VATNGHTGSAASVAGPTLLERAERLDWPEVRFRPACYAGGSQSAWRTFERRASVEDRDQAAAALVALEAGRVA
jgi:hypothetical protein